MKNQIQKLSTALLLLASINSFSQVGIGTQNPQQIFHVDGAKDNPTAGVPSATQALNDVIVNSTGAVGLGLLSPQQKLHISGTNGIGFGSFASDKKLYSPEDGLLEWMSNNSAPARGFSISDQGTKKVFLNINGASYFNGGNVGIGTTSPTEKLEVTGNVKFSGALMPNNNAGTSGQFLVSNGSGNAPTWNSLSTVSGSIAGAYYVQGSNSQNVNQGNTIDVPGMSITLTVPAGRTQTFLFTIQGYAVNQNNCGSCATQGVFSLVRNGAKISSAYTSTGDGGLVNLPAPTTFLKSVTLSAGTYTFKVQYTAWSGNQIVNHNPTNYQGYNGDTECMLSKMQVLVYNN